MSGPGRKINKLNFTRLIGTLVCSALALWSALWLGAALLTVRSEKLIALWEKQSGHLNEQLAAQLIPRIEHSLLLNPLDANTHLMLARLYEQLGISDLAVKQYQLAISNQPTWDYAWARLANFYSKLESTDNRNNEKSAVQALAQAMTLGPYELATQKFVIPLIFKYWQQVVLSPDLETRATEIISHALQYNSNAALALDSGKYYKNLGILEPLVKSESQKNRLNKYKEELKKLDLKAHE